MVITGNFANLLALSIIQLHKLMEVRGTEQALSLLCDSWL